MIPLFIADLHLKVSNSIEPYRSFISFLRYIEDKCDDLYILGDFFSYWYEHDGVDLYSKNPALRAIKEFREKGKKVFFLYGNRDFTAGKFFKEYSGVDYIGEDLIIMSMDKKIYLTHGDKFAKKDIRYQIWRQFIRSGISSFVFKRLPVGYAISLADFLFKKVEKNNPILERIVADMIVNGAVEYFKKGFDIIIAGHAHFKVTRNFNIDGRNKQIFIIPEFRFPGEFLTLENGKFKYTSFG